MLWQGGLKQRKVCTYVRGGKGASRNFGRLNQVSWELLGGLCWRFFFFLSFGGGWSVVLLLPEKPGIVYLICQWSIIRWCLRLSNATRHSKRNRPANVASPRYRVASNIPPKPRNACNQWIHLEMICATFTPANKNEGKSIYPSNTWNHLSLVENMANIGIPLRPQETNIWSKLWAFRDSRRTLLHPGSGDSTRFWRSFTLHGYLPHAVKVEKKKKKEGGGRKKRIPSHPTVLVS